jgi:hypothetical protein
MTAGAVRFDPIGETRLRMTDRRGTVIEMESFDFWRYVDECQRATAISELQEESARDLLAHSHD